MGSQQFPPKPPTKRKSRTKRAPRRSLRAAAEPRVEVSLPDRSSSDWKCKSWIDDDFCKFCFMLELTHVSTLVRMSSGPDANDGESCYCLGVTAKVQLFSFCEIVC